MVQAKWEVLKDLQTHYLACVDLCGKDDEINTLPAKELYKKALHNIDEAKEEIEAFYLEMETCNLPRQQKAVGNV